MAIFTKSEIKAFKFELNSKFVAGIRSSFGVFYIFVVGAGVALASFYIPAWNGSHISPETLGIYVIGILIAVMADSFILMMKSYRDKKNVEFAIAVLFTLFSLILIFLATLLSTKDSFLDDSKHVLTDWWSWSNEVLGFLLVISVVMSLILTGYDSTIDIGPLDRAIADVSDRA